MTNLVWCLVDCVVVLLTCACITYHNSLFLARHLLWGTGKFWVCLAVESIDGFKEKPTCHGFYQLQPPTQCKQHRVQLRHLGAELFLLLHYEKDLKTSWKYITISNNAKTLLCHHSLPQQLSYFSDLCCQLYYAVVVDKDSPCVLSVGHWRDALIVCLSHIKSK